MLPVLYDDLISRPRETLKSIEEFLSQSGGKWESAISRIDPTLRRSKNENIDHHLWSEAERIYDLFKQGRYKDILDEMSDPKKLTWRENRNWYCPRADQQVSERQCTLCRTNPTVRDNFRITAEKKDVDWRNEPCTYECGYGPDIEEPKTPEESIVDNFWVESPPQRKGLLERLLPWRGNR